MSDSVIRLSVPARPDFARSVRMMAANLAVLCSMNVDEVEDARMAAEEAFVYACATNPSQCDIAFCVSDKALSMSFSLGNDDPTADDALAEQVSLATLLLDAVSDTYEVLWDESLLNVTKLVEGVHAE